MIVLETGKQHGKRVGDYTISFARVDGFDRCRRRYSLMQSLEPR
jgi:hypothetical protein